MALKEEFEYIGKDFWIVRFKYFTLKYIILIYSRVISFYFRYCLYILTRYIVSLFNTKNEGEKLTQFLFKMHSF